MKSKKQITILIILLVVIVFGIFFLKKSDYINKNDVKEDENTNQESMEVVEEKDEAKAAVIEKEAASYEEWLAAAMVIAVSLNEEEYDVEHIYYSSETTLENKENSEGVYLIYSTDGIEKCIYSKPIAAERKEKTDLSTQDLGLSTFDEVEIEDIDLKVMKEIELNALSTLIEQSMLVTLYEN